MSRLAMNTRALTRCYTCQVAPASVATPHAVLRAHQTLRFASSASKARPTVEVASKKKISTKSTTPAAPKTTTTRRKTAASTPAPALETAAAPVAPAKRTAARASSTKATPATPSAAKATTTTTASAAAKKKAATTTTTATRKASTSSKDQDQPLSDLRKKTPSVTKDGQQAQRPSDSAAGVKSSGPPSGDLGASRNPGVGTAPRLSATNTHDDNPESLGKIKDSHTDAFTPAYKQAASRYTRLMIAMPILLVTTYYLFDRLGRGTPQKSLDQFREGESSSKPQGA